jgi:hypothetical protein
LDPSCEIPYTLSELPNLEKLRSERLELMWMKSNTEKPEPKRANPKTEIELPMRIRDLKLIELPK